MKRNKSASHRLKKPKQEKSKQHSDLFLGDHSVTHFQQTKPAVKVKVLKVYSLKLFDEDAQSGKVANLSRLFAMCLLQPLLVSTKIEIKGKPTQHTILLTLKRRNYC